MGTGVARHIPLTGTGGTMRDPTDNTLSPEAVQMLVDKAQREHFFESDTMMRLGLCTLRADIAWLADSHETLRQQNNLLAQKLDALKPIIAAAKDYREAQAKRQLVSDDESIQARMADDTVWAAAQQLFRAVRDTDDLGYL